MIPRLAVVDVLAETSKGKLEPESAAASKSHMAREESAPPEIRLGRSLGRRRKTQLVHLLTISPRSGQQQCY